MGRGVGLVVVGLFIGLAGALTTARVLRSLLHGVSATDPVAFSGTVVLLLAVGALASLLPARPAPRPRHRVWRAETRALTEEGFSPTPPPPPWPAFSPRCARAGSSPRR